MQSSRDLAELCSVLDNEPPIKVLTQILSHARLLDIVPIYVYEIMESFASYDMWIPAPYLYILHWVE